MDRASFERLTAALTDRGCRFRPRGSDHLDALCPAHDDGRASLSADWHPAAGDLPGRVLLRCHAGCAAEDVVTALGLVMADLYDGPSQHGASFPRRISSASAAKSAPKPAAQSAAKSAGHRCRWEQVTSYLYADENGAVIGEVIRQRCTRCGAKNFPVRRPAVATDDPARVREGWVYRWPTRRPLYRLPEVLAAVRAGAPVLVVEGEKDADALAEAGAVATCNPGGADNGSGGKWRPEHTATLAGASVVIVADRDVAGYRHAEFVRGQLAPVAAVVSVVEAAIGKDAADHLAAGRGVPEFVAVDPVAKLAALTAPAPADDEGPGATVVSGPWTGDAAARKGGGSGGGGDHAELRKVRRDFRVVDGELCEVVGAGSASVLLNADARLVTRRCVDMADPEEELAVTYAQLQVTFPGRADSWQTTVEWDAFRKANWPQNAPVTLLHGDSTKDRATLYQAIQAVSVDAQRRVVYGCTGWRERDGDPIYVHADGAIGAAGPVSGVSRDSVKLPRALERYALPEPLATPEEIRAAFAGAVARISELEPSHIAAPGMVLPFRTVLGWLPAAGFPTGPRGMGKTAWLAWVCQFFAPATRYNSSFPRPGEDTTRPKLFALLYAAQHTLIGFDDGAPDKGPRPAQEWASMFVRAQFNGSHRELSSRIEGQEPRKTRERARGAGALTAEQLTSTHSADSRPLFVPVDAEDDAIPGFVELDRAGGPVLRARVLATFVAWVARAGLYPRRRDQFGEQLDTPGPEVCDEVREFRAELTAELAPELGPAGDGAVTRLAEIVADWLTGGWFLLRFLREVGAYGEAETDELWEWLRTAMVDLGRRQDSTTEARNPAQRLLRLLRSVLVSGAGHLVSEDGGTPADALALGWEKTSTGSGVFASEHYRARGARLGMRTDAGRVYLIREAVTAELNRAARNSGEELGLTPAQVAAQLDAAGYLRTSVEAGKKQRAPHQRMFGAKDRVWDLSAAVLLGDDEGRDDGGVPDLVDPAPVPPPADDWPGSPDDPVCEVCGCQILFCEPGQTTHPMCAPVAVAPPEHPEPQPAASATRFEAPAVVVDSFGGWLPDGRCLPLSEPMESLADLLEWAEGLRLGLEHEHGMPDDGQVWVMPDVAARLGLPERAPETGGKVHRALAPARAAGWTVAELRSWMRAYRLGGRTLGVAVVGWMPPADHPMLAGNPGGEQLAARLGVWAARTGLSYRLNAGITAVDLIEVVPRRKRLPGGEAPAPPKPAQVARLEEDYLWLRPATSEEARLEWVHAYDANAMYLGAAAQAEVGLCAARHIEGPCDFDPTLPGYWRIEPGSWDDRLLPDLLDPAGRGRLRSQWFTTVTVKRLDALGYAVAPLEAYVYDEHSRYLLPWSNRLRDVRAALAVPDRVDDPDARAVLAEVKAAYTMGVGMLGKPPAKGKPRPWWYRPDWRHVVQAEARSNLTRKLHAAGEAGRHPLAIAVDCVLYASNEADPVAACPAAFRVGTGLGQFKVAGSAPMADVVELLVSSPRNRPVKVLDVVRGLAAGEE